jgi:hypothetical protein
MAAISSAVMPPACDGDACREAPIHRDVPCRICGSLCHIGVPIGHGPSVVNPSPAGFLETGDVLRKRQ